METDAKKKITRSPTSEEGMKELVQMPMWFQAYILGVQTFKLTSAVSKTAIVTKYTSIDLVLVSLFPNTDVPFLLPPGTHR